MKNICPGCSKEFITYPSKISLGRGIYCSKKCSFGFTNKKLVENGIKTRFLKGQVPHNYKGYRLTWAGYIEIYYPDHPYATRAGYVREHRLVMEKFLGRFLERDEDVHHINGNRTDNRLENLELLSHSEHTRLHNPIWLRWNKNKGKVMPNAHYAK